jgi:predicted esterase YcpF (UPF0227 family)
MLIYIHGFNSSALSYKAGLVASRMAALGRGAGFVCPELPDRPAQAMAVLEDCVKRADVSRVALIGSSLGGFYATSLAERYAVRAVLVNPAVRPYELLTKALGPQENLYTHAKYVFTEDHLNELRALEVPEITPSRYFLITRTGDEVLDYRDAVERYRGCAQLVIEGGDHGFDDFSGYVDRALAFCGMLAA